MTLRRMIREAGPGEPPIELEVWWCPECGSLFLHHLGTRHIRQSGQGGECHGRLVELQFYR